MFTPIPYRDLNDIKYEFGKIPELKIKELGYNEDITLEDIWAILHVKGKGDLTVYGLWTVWDENGKKKMESNYKDGKIIGLQVIWHENGQKSEEVNYKDGEEVEGSDKYWNSKGEPVDSREEARK